MRHPVGSDPAWSESYYFNFVDHSREIGMFTRMGFRANQGWADGLHVVFLGGRRVAFCYDRRDLGAGDHDLEVGGLSLERVDPFRSWRVRYHGRAQDIEDAAVLATRRRHRPEGWYTPAELKMEAEFTALAAPHYDPLGQQGHFEQTGRVTGHIILDRETWEFDGLGVRDKSWGARSWTLPLWAADPVGARAAGPSPLVIWCSGNFGPDLALGCCLVDDHGDGLQLLGGWLQEEGRTKQLRSATVDSAYRQDSLLHSGLGLEAVCFDGTRFEVAGEVLTVCPTKIPVPGGATFVNEGLTRYTLGDRTGYGIAEYWHLVTS
jgi:hypothetical protein